MGLETNNLENFDKENEIKEVINVWKAETDELFVTSLKSMKENQFASFVKKSFKNQEWEWQTYSQMKRNPYYWFMVQAAIDMLSDKLKENGVEKKFNDNWEPNQNWKTLDELINDAGWIDNKYWPKTRKIVMLVQKILKINVDGSAGPQFFAKVCSVLEWRGIVEDFKVQWYDNDSNTYRFNFDDKNKSNEDSLDSYKFGINTIKVENWITLDSSHYISYNGIELGQFPYVTEKGVIELSHNNKYDAKKKWMVTIRKTWDATYKLEYQSPVNQPDKNSKQNKSETQVQNNEQKKAENVGENSDDNMAQKFNYEYINGNYGWHYILSLKDKTENTTPINSNLYKIQFDSLAQTFSNNGWYYWFKRDPYTWYNYASNPYVWVNCWSHDSASMGNAAKDPDFKVKINLHDFMKNDDWSLDNDGILRELNRIKSQFENSNAIAKSKNELYSSINTFTLKEIWLWDKANQPWYIALMDYFEDWKIKIDKKHTLPKRDNSWNLIFDLDPKWSWSCPDYFTGIKIKNSELINSQWKYDIEQFKIAFAKKLDEIVNKNILSTI